MDLVLFRIERFSVKNGPGIRTTVFFKGCPLRCAWCANPESQSPFKDLLYNSELCIPGCAECVASCSESALSVRDGRAHVDRSLCVPCDECSAVCPSKALASTGFVMSRENLLDELEKDRVFHESSGGGVTLSGGEPLHQPDAALALLEALGARRTSRVLDTSGAVSPEVFRAALELCELVFVDLKIADGKKHEYYTGADNSRIIDNLGFASKAAPEKLVVRIPLIPGVNDGNEDAARVGRILGGLRFKAVHVLPYHRLGIAKYGMLGRSYTLPEVKAPRREDLLRFTDILRECGVSAELQG